MIKDIERLEMLKIDRRRKVSSPFLGNDPYALYL